MKKCMQTKNVFGEKLKSPCSDSSPGFHTGRDYPLSELCSLNKTGCYHHDPLLVDTDDEFAVWAVQEWSQNV